MYISRTGRRWCSAAVQVQWQHGKRVFTHEGTGVYKEHLLPAPFDGSFTYYEMPDGSTGHADVLPFNVANVDPHVEMTESGFVWLPTGETWTRVKKGTASMEYYNAATSVEMTVSRNPQQQATEQQQQVDKERSAEDAAAVAKEKEETERMIRWIDEYVAAWGKNQHTQLLKSTQEKLDTLQKRVRTPKISRERRLQRKRLLESGERPDDLWAPAEVEEA